MGKVSVIVPVHNEAKNLERNIKELERQLNLSLGDFEIIISEDGSTDRTAEISRLHRSDKIRVLNSSERLGKGAAIKLASAKARGNIIIFMDADLASQPASVKDLVKHIEGGAAIVVGSRYLKDSKAKRSVTRLIASKAFNWLVILLFNSKINDHQCGFKAFQKELVLPTMDEIENIGWFWDAELLIRTQRKGLKVVEIPIEWTEAQGSKFQIINDSMQMAYCLARFKLKNG